MAEKAKTAQEMTKEERARRFAWGAGDLTTEGICNFCLHLRANGGCDAFPFGIPVEIRNGTLDHRQPIEGDNDIQYEERKKI